MKLVRCERCYVEGKNNWLRFENTVPVVFLAQAISITSGVIKPLNQNMYLCKEHYDQYAPLEEWTTELKN